MPGHKKYDLLDVLIQSITDCGWNIIYLSDIKYHPFNIEIYKDSENYILNIYIWHLTHGGGVKRPADEYRIQITGVNRFLQPSKTKTLILGWWREGSVFAGFDYYMHKGLLGFSPSIQIKEESLRKALINGVSSYPKENKEIAIAFRPDFIVDYIKNLESLHSIGESRKDSEIFEEIIEKPEKVNKSLFEQISESRKSTVLNVTKIIRDNSFKARVLNAYGYMCTFCGIQLKLIDAAHIIPVSFKYSTDETCNGLALCPLHHRAFDKALVTINDKYQILINKEMIHKLIEIKHDKGLRMFEKNLRPLIHVPPSITDRPHIEYIKKANELRGWIYNS